jgi:two-component system, OmpR family, response regulator
MPENTKHRILLCEDDINLGIVLKDFLELNDYQVVLERDGRLGFAAFSQGKFDLCLLDVMMPKVDGFKLAENIRDMDPEVPLFFLSAKTMKEDIIQGYKLGADDYITKPFDSEVLLLKIKAIIKRNNEQNAFNDSVEYDFGPYHYVPRLRELTVNGNTEKLSPKEGGLLRLLLENQNDLLSREEALKKVWGGDSYFNGRSMDVYIAKLRKYLVNDAGIEIKNIHGNGFKMIVPE